MSLTYYSIYITEYSLSWSCYSLSETCHSLCERGPGAWVTRFAAIWGSLMDHFLIIYGSVYWIGPPDMWINHSGKTVYTTVLWGSFRAYLLTVTTDTLRFLAGSRASPVTGLRRAPTTYRQKSPDIPIMYIYPSYTAYSLRMCNVIYAVAFVRNV